MTTNKTRSLLAKALLGKKKKSDSYFKHILFLLHLWLGLIVGGVICFVALTGALYVFKSEVEDLSAYGAIHRDTPATSLANTVTLIANFEQQYTLSPSRITIPENSKHNIRIQASERGKSAVTAFADRETGELVGEISPKVSEFFKTIMFLHRWFNMENYKVGRQIVGACTLVFLLLLISGLILWFPKITKKNKWYNKFNIRFKSRFAVWNRDLHLNVGMYAFVFLIVIGWTGTFFTYDWVKHITIDSFKPKQEQEQGREQEHKHQHVQKREHAGEMKKPKGADFDKKEALAALDFDALVLDANKHLNYSGDVSIMLSGKGVSTPTIRKTNTHNLLGAVLSDDVKYSYQGELQEVSTFKSKPFYQKIGGLIKAIHTGEVLGLKSKIFNFLLALFGAYLPISGYLMWFKKLKAKS